MKSLCICVLGVIIVTFAVSHSTKAEVLPKMNSSADKVVDNEYDQENEQVIFSETDILSETQVTADEIIDNEYDQENARFTFTDKDGYLWVGNVDRATGDFVPPNGHAILVDTDAAFATDFGNGPEWFFTDQGHEIVYTKYLPGAPHRSYNAGCAIAKMQDDKWFGGFMPVGVRAPSHSPLGSLDEGDMYPRVNFQGVSTKTVFWEYLYNPATEEQVPQSDQSGGSRRWVPGQHKIIFTAACVNNQNITEHQVFMYDIDNKDITQLTHDIGAKMGAFMWRAPEYANAYVFATTVDRIRLQVYRVINDGTGNKWTLFDTIKGPDSIPYIWSPEAFIYNERSYIFMQLSSSKNANDMKVPTQIGITGIAPEHPNFHMLTNDNAIKRVRMDPEVFVTDKGPFIYYNRYIAATKRSKSQPEGIWRVDTKLAPPE